MTRTAATPSDDIHSTLGLNPAGRRRRLARWFVTGLVVIVVVIGIMRIRAGNAADASVQYQTQPVTEGTLIVTVTATGELKPLTQVNIGTEISGIVEDTS